MAASRRAQAPSPGPSATSDGLRESTATRARASATGSPFASAVCIVGAPPGLLLGCRLLRWLLLGRLACLRLGARRAALLLAAGGRGFSRRDELVGFVLRHLAAAHHELH